MPPTSFPELICAEDLPVSGDCIENATTEVVSDAIAEASYIVYRMSGGRVFGVRDATVRPQPRRFEDCTEPPTITLAGPVVRVRWVTIDGATLAPSAYRLLDGDKLLRVDGLRWPTYQDLTKPLSEANTFAVRYSYGREVDAVTKRATVDTAVELIKLAVPDANQRRLPPNVRSTNASGVSLSMQDRNQLIRELGSYLESVNRFMALHNPAAEPETFVYSPDTSPRLHALDGNG